MTHLINIISTGCVQIYCKELSNTLAAWYLVPLLLLYSCTADRPLHDGRSDGVPQSFRRWTWITIAVCFVVTRQTGSIWLLRAIYQRAWCDKNMISNELAMIYFMVNCCSNVSKAPEIATAVVTAAVVDAAGCGKIFRTPTHTTAVRHTTQHEYERVRV